MIRPPVLATGLLLVCIGMAEAQAPRFDVELVARTPNASVAAHAEATATPAKATRRAILEAPAGTPITIHWRVTNTASKRAVKDLLIHFVAVREERVGQLESPKLDRDVAAETACNMDFEPGDSARGELRLTLDRPGVYLLRVETIDAGKRATEYFAALDFVAR